MIKKRPSTIAEYIEAAPEHAREHLNKLYLILKAAAPNAEEAIKWSTPCFVEPRFLFAFAAYKSYATFEPTAAALDPFRNELSAYKMTDNHVHFTYDKPIPTTLLRKIAKNRVKFVNERDDSSFW